MLQELYQELIVDHSKRPRHFGALPDATACKEGFNPLCGDKLMLYVVLQQNVIEKLFFEGKGCAISIASASLMAEALQGKSCEAATELFHHFHQVITQGKVLLRPERDLGKLAALSGVAEYPARVKCATLAWHTLQAILQNDNNACPVRTE